MKKELSAEQKRAKADYAKMWRIQNPEKTRQHAQKTRLKNREKILERQREWTRNNSRHIKQKALAYYQANKEKIRQKNWLKTYGLSQARYFELLEAQHYSCAICKIKEPGKGEYFAVDHDHKNGRVRALLCVHCNVGLGHFKDNPELLMSAIQYLTNHREVSILPETEEPLAYLSAPEIVPQEGDRLQALDSEQILPNSQVSLSS